MTEKVSLVLDPLEGIYIEEGEGRRTSKKYVTMDDLREMFVNNLRLDTGILPQNCVYYLKEDGKTIMLLAYQPQKRTVLYHGRGSSNVQEYIVPVPYTVFGLCISGGRVRETLCATSMGPIADTSTRLYHFPFGNVWQDNNRICWGRTRIPNVASPVQAGGIPNLFFTAPFNGDLSDNGFVGWNHENNHLGHFLQQLTELEYFPTNKLVSGSINTVNDMVERLRRIQV